MLRRYLFSILAILLLYACNKSEETTLPSEDVPRYKISGKLFIQTGYSNATAHKELGGQKVFIRIDTSSNKDTSNYFYSVLSGGNGSFTFYVSDTTLPYAVFSATTYKSSPAYVLNYYGAAYTTKPFSGNTSLQLVMPPDTMQNGINLTTLDAAGNRAGRAGIMLYTSQAIAMADALPQTGNGCLARASTDSMGRAFISGLPEDKLYLNARIISGVDTFLTVAQPVQVPKRRLVTDTLVLVKK